MLLEHQSQSCSSSCPTVLANAFRSFVALGPLSTTVAKCIGIMPGWRSSDTIQTAFPPGINSLLCYRWPTWLVLTRLDTVASGTCPKTSSYPNSRARDQQVTSVLKTCDHCWRRFHGKESSLRLRDLDNRSIHHEGHWRLSTQASLGRKRILFAGRWC